MRIEKPHRQILYSVRSRKRVLENAYLWRCERENNKEQGYYAEHAYSYSWAAADVDFTFELTCFINKSYCRRDEENGDIYIVGRRTDNSVIGIK